MSIITEELAPVSLTMKAPPHPGRLVRDTLDERKLSIASAALGLGITRQQLHNVCVGRSSITPEMAVRLEKAFGGKAEVWLRLQAAHDLAEVRQREHDLDVTSFQDHAA